MKESNLKYKICNFKFAILFLLSQFCCTGGSFSQSSKIDSIQSAIHATQEDTIKVRLMLSLCSEYLELNENDKVNNTCREIITICRRMAVSKKNAGWLKQTAARVFGMLGKMHNGKKNHDKAFAMHRRAYSISEGIYDSTGMANALNNIALIYFSQDNYDSAIQFQKQSLALYDKKVNKKEISSGLQNLGAYYYRKGILDTTLQYYLKSLKMKDENNDFTNYASLLSQIGLILMKQSNFDEALHYQLVALDICKKLNNMPDMALCFNNLGRVFSEKARKSGNRDSIKFYFRKAIEAYSKSFAIREKLGDKDGMVRALNNIGLIYYYLNDYGKAIDNYNKALTIVQSMGNLFLEAAVDGNIGFTLTAKGEYAKALPYIEHALAIGKQVQSPDLMKECYQAISELWQQQGNYQKAYEAFAKYVNLKDTMLNEETSKQITEMQTKYESEKKENEILILIKDKQIQGEEVKRQRILRNSFIAASALALLLAFVLFNRYKLKQKANKLLAKQNEQIGLQKTLIEQQKQDITDSIEYASNIQMAMLPSEEEIKSSLPECFVLYKPKAIVSGDFYWLAQAPPTSPKGGVASLNPSKEGIADTSKNKENTGDSVIKSPFGEDLGGLGLLLCTADCTGHGVPGAFMSMLCTALLNEAVNDKGITSPEKVFEEVRKGIIAALKQRGKMGEAKDGMDATIIQIKYRNAEHPDSPDSYRVDALSLRTQIVTFLRAACANNPIYIISNGELMEFKPDRFPIGVYEGELKPFTLHSATLQKGDMIYTMTDGFEDQLDGEKGKKFKSKRLKELLLSIALKPVKEQKEILENAFEEWKGSGEQTDDVTVIGIRT